MEKQIEKFLSLIFIGNINVRIEKNDHLITIGDIYTPFELKTYPNFDNKIVEERTTRLVNDTIEISYSYVNEINFMGTLVSNDLALVYKDKTITGGIYLSNGQTAFISAKIDEYGNIEMLDINVFDNIFDMAMFSSYEDDDIGALITYSGVDKKIEALKEKGINSSLSMQIDFNQLLKERHHSGLKNYISLINIFKDIIIRKIEEEMQIEKVKIK